MMRRHILAYVPVFAVLLATAATSNGATAELPLPVPGPFVTAFSFSVRPSAPHVARMRRILVRAVGGLFKGNGLAEPELYLTISCEYSTPCAPYLGGVNRTIGDPPEARLELLEHERTSVTSHTKLLVEIRRYAYVRRPEAGGSPSSSGRIVDVSSVRLKVYALQRSGRTRLKLGQVKEECLTSPVPSSVPAGEAEPEGFATSPVYYTSTYVKVRCPATWTEPGNGILSCPHERPTECVPVADAARVSRLVPQPRLWTGFS